MNPILNVIDDALKKKGLSDAAASRLAVGHEVLIKKLRLPAKGEKRYNYLALEKLAKVLDLELYFGPPREQPANPKHILNFSNAPKFSPTENLPLRGFASCGLQGWGKTQLQNHHLPKPVEFNDPDAFYVKARGQSMIPEGIKPGNYCLVSPIRPPEPMDRVWIKDHEGKTAIKRLVKIGKTTLTLRGWLPMENGQQKSFDEERVIAHIQEFHPIIGVFRDMENEAGQKPTLVTDPKHPDIQSPSISDSADYSLIKLHNVQAAAGAGRINGQSEQPSSLAFNNIWLNKLGINPDAASLIYVAGDSMEPTLQDGSIVLIDHQQREPVGKHIYAIRNGDELMVKRLEKPDVKTLLLTSDNPKYATKVLTGFDLKAVGIVGKVVWSAFTLDD
ncbi:MAG: hypothetical protein JKX71_10090 [Amylibacter sp.]|nr:hypothetical protein [Amylibacter sp.]